MNKRDYILSMILGIVLAVVSLIAALTGFSVPNSTTPWFWLVLMIIFLGAVTFTYFKYKG